MKYAKQRMLELKMSKSEIFVVLVSVLQGRAKTMVMKLDHQDGDFNLTMRKLEKEFLTNIYLSMNYQPSLNSLIKCPKDATKMSEFYREDKTITNQLRKICYAISLKPHFMTS